LIHFCIITVTPAGEYFYQKGFASQNLGAGRIHFARAFESLKGGGGESPKPKKKTTTLVVAFFLE
jgi:hypothetical protein